MTNLEMKQAERIKELEKHIEIFNDANERLNKQIAKQFKTVKDRSTKLENMLKTMTYDVIELDQCDGNVLGMMREDPDMVEFLEDESVQELIAEIEEE